MGFMVSPAVQGQVRHPSIVPEFLRSTSFGMTSARGHGAIFYCLNSGSEDRQMGRHNGEKKETGGERERGDGRRRREETEKERRGDGKGEGKRVGERQRGSRLVWRKGLSPGLEWKDDERRWR
ncbi:hypothetical protein TNCV_469101 [Trichonephila clavipes]|nr:hypothetical protein TNCV_469101 [Trichonephila clavipes]